MKFVKILTLITSVLLINACNKNLNTDVGTAAPVDLQQLSIASRNLCPAGQTFKTDTTKLDVSQLNQQQRLFTFQKGSERCATLHNVDHGGLTSWLKIDYSNNCLANGTLWKAESISVFDGEKVYINLAPLDVADKNWVRIFTSYYYSLNTMNQEIGLTVYTCAN